MVETEIIYNGSKERVKAYKEFDKKTRSVTFYLDDKKMFPIDKDEEDFIEYVPTPYELFGIECGEGWMKLIQPILDYIKEYNLNTENDRDKIEILQIKEKLGILVIYVENATTELHDMINKASEESSNVCEECGSTTNIGKTAGWVETICHNCILNKSIKNDKAYAWRSNDDNQWYEINKGNETLIEKPTRF